MTDLVTEFDVEYVGANPTLNILALDLGTYCGWALARGAAMTYGTSVFAPKRHDGPGQRWLKFRAMLARLYNTAGELHAIYYEDVKNHAGTQAAHCYGGFESQLQVFCDINRVRLVGVGVGQIKKAWTGRGNSNKDEMIDEARRRGFKVSADADDTADALAILNLAMKVETK
ncbi:polynucleotidyl transferase [Trinickia mobilis]|uniref:polynucleotidyl transferase n=1 Tax=Trinickia mobilis TaxID=2816356 RepID=UPI001A8E159C|nr:polynucleotidyl transferase [Trinickia mobilis]